MMTEEQAAKSIYYAYSERLWSQCKIKRKSWESAKMTAAHVADVYKQARDMIAPSPTLENRISHLEAAVRELNPGLDL